MNRIRLLTLVSAIAASVALLAAPATAQTPRPAKPKPQQVTAQQTPAAPVEKCLRALNGACTNAVSVEAVRLRAEIIPAVTVSYFGTPAGTFGGDYIPFERLFQDNPVLFGLPTNVFVNPACCVRRSK